jgi:hypothetical protein
MTRFVAIFAFASGVLVSAAQAHVRVLPFESQPGAHQTYSHRALDRGLDCLRFLATAKPRQSRK